MESPGGPLKEIVTGSMESSGGPLKEIVTGWMESSGGPLKDHQNTHNFMPMFANR